MKQYLACITVTAKDNNPECGTGLVAIVGCSNLRHAIKLKSTIKGWGLINAGYLATSGLANSQTIATARILWASVISFVLIKHREASQIHRQTIRPR